MPLIHHAAFYHPHHYGFPPHNGGGFGQYLGRMVMNAMIYSAIFRVMRHIPMPILLVIIVVVVIVMWRNRGRQY